MSVLVDRRKLNMSKVVLDARQLAAYSIKVTSNPNNFLKETSENLVNNLQNTAMLVYDFIYSANNVYVNNKKTAIRRIELQVSAIEKLSYLGSLIFLSQTVFHYDSKRIRYWTKLINDLKKEIISRKKSEINKYKESYGQNFLNDDDSDLI